MTMSNYQPRDCLVFCLSIRRISKAAFHDGDAGMYPHRIINKVPGNIPTEPKKEKQGYIGDLSQMTVVQLNELLERQLKLLKNKAFTNKLADKGEKITKLKDSIETELRKRNESENLSQMLSALSMNGKEDLDALEWTGRCAPGYVAAAEENMSDEETDPLRILATHSGAGFHKKKHRIIKHEEPLIRPSDIEEVESNKCEDQQEDMKLKETEVLDEYAKHLCEKMDSVKSTDQKSKFMPHRTLVGLVEHKKSESKTGRVRGKWEVTAATPPPPVHGDVKMVSLQESIRLQFDQQQKLKEVQMRHAADRLVAGYSLSIGHAPQRVGDYRDPASGTSSEDEGSEHEVHDEEEPDGGGVVIYNLVDDHENS